MTISHVKNSIKPHDKWQSRTSKIQEAEWNAYDGGGSSCVAGHCGGGAGGTAAYVNRGDRRVCRRLEEFDVPQNPISSVGERRGVDRHRVAPRRGASVGPEELVEDALEPDAAAVAERQPVDARAEAKGRLLEHLLAGEVEEGGLRAVSGEVAAVEALEAEPALFANVGEDLDGPPGTATGAVSIQPHVL